MVKRTTTLKINWEKEEPDGDGLDLALEYIMGLIRDGCTSGYAAGNIMYWELR